MKQVSINKLACEKIYDFYCNQVANKRDLYDKMLKALLIIKIEKDQLGEQSDYLTESTMEQFNECFEGDYFYDEPDVKKINYIPSFNKGNIKKKSWNLTEVDFDYISELIEQELNLGLEDDVLNEHLLNQITEFHFNEGSLESI